jgi:hypothetical protein
VLCAVFIAKSLVSGAPQESSDIYVKPLLVPDDVNSTILLQDTPITTLSQTSTTPVEDRKDDQVKTEDVTESTTYSVKDTTLIYESTETESPQKKKKFPSPRFISKLSYFKNTDDYSGHNFIERTGRRKFRSRCRCEKITNCPKLQITVPRCPEELFLCCF